MSFALHLSSILWSAQLRSSFLSATLCGYTQISRTTEDISLTDLILCGSEMTSSLCDDLQLVQASPSRSSSINSSSRIDYCLSRYQQDGINGRLQSLVKDEGIPDLAALSASKFALVQAFVAAIIEGASSCSVCRAARGLQFSTRKEASKEDCHMTCAYGSYIYNPQFTHLQFWRRRLSSSLPRPSLSVNLAEARRLTFE